MKLSYVDVASGREMDQIDIQTDRTIYSTGVAKDMVDGYISHYGRKQATTVLRSWSNGYAKISEIVD